MGMDFDDEQLMICLLKFVSGSSVQFQLVDLYGNNKPSQLFDTTTTTTATEYHVFTQLKKKKGNGKNFNRGIVGGGGSWKGVDNSRPVYDKKKSVIGFKKTFRFEEKNHVWIMKEYRLCDKILKALTLRGHTRHEEEFVVCRITRSSVNSSKVIIPSDHNVENFLDSLLISSLQCQESFAQNQFQDLGQSFAQNQFQDLGQSFAQNQFQDLGQSFAQNQFQDLGQSFAQNQFQDLGQSFAQYQFQDLGQLSTPNVIPSDESSSILNGNQIGPVSLVLKESKLSAVIEEECSVPVVHQQTPSVKEVECSVYDIATYHKQLDAYAASVLESIVPYIPEPPQDDEADSIPPFYEDFYIGFTDLWS
uniref:NAC transcription factor n=1 Tax=Solanum tuberosum TaxID=4113 RepID=M1DBG5_SOLTU